MTTTIDYIREHQNRFIEELFALLKIPSVSTLKEHAGDIRQAAEWLAAHCQQLGMTRVEVFETAGHPIVYGEWLGAGESAPTVLVYGHYDVQPAELSDGWKSEPFQPEIRDGNIFARGATDDKGQLFIHLKVFEAFMKTDGRFPVNLKVVLEGEEEASSINLPLFIQEQRELLKADVAVISDTSMFAPGIPAIPYGLRGLITTRLEISGPRNDLHSGMYGGAVHNPIHALSQLIATMHDAEGHVTVEGFYDEVRPLPDDERAKLAEIPYTEVMWRQETGAPQPWGEPEYTLQERTGARPTLEVTSIKGGFLGEGLKNIVPEKAVAILTCRLVAYQRPETAFKVLQAHLEKYVPPTVHYRFELVNFAPPVLVDPNTAWMKVAIQAYQQVFGREPVFNLVGGSIPVVTDFQETLNIPTLLLGFALADDNLHAPNEKFGVEQFKVGLETMAAFYQLLAEQGQA